MLANEAISLIYTLAQKIYAQYQLVKANKAQCQRFHERTQVIIAAIQKLEHLPDKKQYEPGLNALSTTLSEALELMQAFSQSNWFMVIIKAGNHQSRFAALTEALRQNLEQLNLGLNAQQLINREQDKADQQHDLAMIQHQQQEIIQLNQQAIAHMQYLRLEQQQGQNVLQQQLASLKAHLQALLKPAQPVKPILDPHLTVPFYELRFDQVLTQSDAGGVYQGRWLEQPVAIKMLEGDLTPQQLSEFSREVQILSRLRSPRIVQLYGACLEAGRACLVMEYHEQRTLSDTLNTCVLTPPQQKQIAHDMACGLYYLQQKGIVHRALNSDAVLVDDQYRAKLTEFGLAKITTLSINTAVRQSPTLAYCAPELLQGLPAHDKSDVFSLGVLLWQVFTGQIPFANWEEIKIVNAIKNGQREILPDSVPSAIGQLIKQCWEADPTNRPDAFTIIQTLAQYAPRPASPTPEASYQRGLECEQQQQDKEALTHYERAAQKGHTKAKTNLGLFFLKGRGQVTPDKTKAQQLFLAAAQAGHARAMVNLATMLEKGDGVKQDLNAALYWYEQAQANGAHEAAPKIAALKAQVAAPVYQAMR